MSVIITKQAGIKFAKKDVSFEVIFKRPYYISVAYVENKHIYIQKFKTDQEDKGWKCLESLTECSFIAFFHEKREKIFEKNIKNLCPILINENLSYVVAGAVLSLTKAHRKEFSDVFFFKEFAFASINEMCPNFFFSYEGKWFMKKILPDTSAMAFIRSDGKISIINESQGETFKEMWYFDNESANRKYSIFAKKK